MNMKIDCSGSGVRSALVAVLTVLSISPAQAYVDPGTGSMLLQMGLAAIAGALFYFRQLRLAFADWFRRTILRHKSEVIDADATPSATDGTR